MHIFKCAAPRKANLPTQCTPVRLLQLGAFQLTRVAGGILGETAEPVYALHVACSAEGELAQAVPDDAGREREKVTAFFLLPSRLSPLPPETTRTGSKAHSPSYKPFTVSR